jgi:hypothetical protein
MLQRDEAASDAYIAQLTAAVMEVLERMGAHLPEGVVRSQRDLGR